MFDDFLLRRTDADVRRVVLLGAGLDARTYRLPWPRGCTVFEVDQEEVLAFKQRAPGTGRPGRPCPGPRARRVTVAADLRLDSIRSLRAPGFGLARPTAWLAEGLLLHLPSAAESRLIDTLDAYSAPGSALAYEVKHQVESAAVRDSPIYTAACEHIGVDLLTLFDQDPRPDSAMRLGERGRHAGVCTPFHFTHRLGRGPRPETYDAPAANRWIFASRPRP